jgi:hypothetical protein
MAGKARNIWQREEDDELWARVETYAKQRRMTVSAVVALALERLLKDIEDGKGPAAL